MPQPRGFRGGHAPGHLRDAFLESLDRRLGSDGEVDADVASFFDSRMQQRWESWDGRERARWLLGQLFSCSDILPGLAAQEVTDLGDVWDPPKIATYANVARFLMKLHDLDAVAV